MTTNQIQYLRNQEDKRHNIELERQGLMGLDVQQQQADTQKKQLESAYITAMANAKQAEAAMNQANARWGELQYKYDTIPLYEREVAAKETTAEASATTADANATNAETNRSKLDIERQQLDIDWARVRQLSAEISTKFAHNAIDQERLENAIYQQTQELALARDDLERKKVQDKWDRWFRGFEAIGHNGQRVIDAINQMYNLKLNAFRTLRDVVGTNTKTTQSGFGSRSR